VTKKYPLEPLARVRASRTEEAARELAQAIGARERAQRRVAEAEAERTAARAAQQALRDGERKALERGELAAVDLMRGGAWEARAKEEIAQLERQLASATAREAEARAKEAGAKNTVAERSAEEKVVDADRARWAERERKKQEGREEEAGAEAWRPKRG
jgi:hypothetical protein